MKALGVFEHSLTILKSRWVTALGYFPSRLASMAMASAARATIAIANAKSKYARSILLDGIAFCLSEA